MLQRTVGHAGRSLPASPSSWEGSGLSGEKQFLMLLDCVKKMKRLLSSVKRKPGQKN